jgi:hypothetical protein
MARRYFADALSLRVHVSAREFVPGRGGLVALPGDRLASDQAERLALARGGEQFGAEDVGLGGSTERTLPRLASGLPADLVGGHPAAGGDQVVKDVSRA